MGTFNQFKNAIGFLSDDDKVKTDSAIAASAREKALRKYDRRSMLSPALTSQTSSDLSHRKNLGDQAAREAEAEVKREMRGVQKTETDRAREEANEIRMQKANEKAYNQSLRSEGMRNGGVTRADGCISKGHTKGKMISMGG
ncbi:hypothetical protein EBT31_02155 [bacterium]|jgi:hypothetical protein|nr:hypothetical protein [bacterium]